MIFLVIESSKGTFAVFDSFWRSQRFILPSLVPRLIDPIFALFLYSPSPLSQYVWLLRALVLIRFQICLRNIVHLSARSSLDILSDPLWHLAISYVRSSWFIFALSSLDILSDLLCRLLVSFVRSSWYARIFHLFRSLVLVDYQTLSDTSLSSDARIVISFLAFSDMIWIIHSWDSSPSLALFDLRSLMISIVLGGQSRDNWQKMTAIPLPKQWTVWGLSPGPPACWAGVIPLHHVPSRHAMAVLAYSSCPEIL